MAEARVEAQLDRIVLTGGKTLSLPRSWIPNLTYGLVLGAVDCVAIILSFLVAFLFRFLVFPSIAHVTLQAVPVDPFLDAWLIVLWIAVFFYEGLYARGLGSWDELVRIPKAVLFSALLTVGGTFAYHTSLEYSRVVLAGTCFLAIVAIPAFRVYVKTQFLSLAFPVHVLILRDFEARTKTNPQISLLNQCGYKTVSIVPIASGDDEAELRQFVHSVAAEHNPDEVVLDPEGLGAESLRKVLRCVEACGHPVRLLSSLAVCQPQASVRNVDGVVLFDLNHGLARPLSCAAKRAMDLMGAAILLMLCSPVFLLIAILIKLDSRGPVFYGHRRLAPEGRTFLCFKFRTMFQDAEERLKLWMQSGHELAREFQVEFKLKNDPRVTRVGTFLRKLSLDELPQLINVVRGEMSLVGPRPIVSEEVSKYGGDFQYLRTIKGGMTGLWQVSGRNDIGYSERIALDTYYARNWSCWLDLVILLKTVGAVLKRSGAY